MSHALKVAGLSIPQKPQEKIESQISISVFILPDHKTKGMLETLCNQSVEKDPAMLCVDNYIKCLEENLNEPPRNIEKARLQTFLASRKRVPRMVGIAAKQGVWPWDSPVFEGLKEFLRCLNRRGQMASPFYFCGL